jgi:hypothetical protein
MHGKLVHEAKKETVGFWGEKGRGGAFWVVSWMEGFLLGFGTLLSELLIFSVAPVSC